MTEKLNHFISFLIERQNEIIAQTFTHLYLTLFSLFWAILIGVSVGVWLSRSNRLAGSVLGMLGIIQTIPSLALLGFLLPWLGIGAVPAIIALFLYALLPIVRNTYTGIVGVDRYVMEAAKGMGLTPFQVLFKIEFPLALPTIFAGIRTAAVINVGVATLCALIAAGGLGEFIFRGIALNNTQMILAGAIPSALLALVIDGFLAIMQRYIQAFFRSFVYFGGFILLSVVGYWLYLSLLPQPFIFKAGFDAEFMERPDGYKGLAKHYQIQFPIQKAEFDASLMYQALHKGQVDMIGGYSTDGRIDAFQLQVLEDDKAYFPPYYVVPLIHQRTLEKYPFLGDVLEKITQKISDAEMRQMNFETDEKKKNPAEVAKHFLKSKGFQTSVRRTGKADILIGGKKFTEQYILTEIFKLLIENYTSLTVELKNGLGGTQIAFEALHTQEIDMYPEYTGTVFLSILNPDTSIQQKIIRDKDKVFQYVRQNLRKTYQIQTLNPLGFNNTYALMMRKADTQKYQLQTISDLATYLNSKK